VRLLIAGKPSLRDHCILTILLNCALRISELEALNCSQVSADVLSVIGKGNKERKIYLTPAAKSSVAAWMKIRSGSVVSDALFISRNSRRMTVRSLQAVVKKYVRFAGSTVSAHTLRHTSATLMYKYGRVDIRSLQKILGHESVATTEIYTHIDDSQLQAAVNSNPLAIMFS
jgi:site-specific recombinase XerD